MREYNLKRFGVTFLALFLLLAVHVTTVHATAVPDIKRKGSITVAMKNQNTGNAVSGGTITLFKVGNVREDDGNFSFVLTEKFKGSRESLKTLDADLAKRLADYADEQDLNGTTAGIGSDGKAKFSKVKPGLYLLVQKESADGYHAISPFLVSVPLLEDESYLYDVDAAPKMEPLSRQPKRPDKGTDTDPDPSTSGYPTGNTPPTGDNSHPVFWIGLLAVGILGLAGAMFVRKKRRE